MDARKSRLWCMSVTVLLAAVLLGGCARTVGMRVGFDLQRPQAVMQYANLGFNSGERFRLRMMPDQDCYVYVLHEGTDGSYVMLFPMTEIESGKNFCRARTWVEIPSTGWYRLDEKAGIERLIVLACSKHIGEIEALRNRPLAPNEVKAVLMAVEDTHNTRVSQRLEEKRLDCLYYLVASRDEFPVLHFKVDLVHQ